MKSKIIGFDFRVKPNSKLLADRWTSFRREEYLLKPNLSVPLSVDRWVWPSLFSFEDGPVNQEFSLVRINPTNFHQQGLRVWADLSQMQVATDSAHLPQTEGCMVCFTLEYEDSELNAERWQMAFEEQTMPSQVSLHWDLKGFDIADCFFTSGLSNCSYPISKIQQYRQVWEGSINTNGLLANIDAAKSFKEFANGRVSAHAPFYVFGIYEIKERHTSTIASAMPGEFVR